MAQPGTLNYVEGQVSINNEALAPQQASAMMLPSGSALSTGTTGFAEVLLTPGAFLRVGPNSQIRLNNAGLASTQIQLDRGVANVEVDQFIEGTQLVLTMNAATIQIEKRGLYDFNVEQQSVKVLDGKVNVASPTGSKSIGKGDQLLLASDKPFKSRSFNMKAEAAQPLYVWSEARSRTESQANVAVAQNVAVYGGWYGAGGIGTLTGVPSRSFPAPDSYIVRLVGAFTRQPSSAITASRSAMAVTASITAT